MRKREGESRIHGLHACRALVQRRRDDVRQVFLTEERARQLGDLLRWCASQRRPYRIVEDSDLERLTESRHHEGICIVARTPPPARLTEVLAAPGPAVILGLVGVGNPHNLGAILRSAAHFGARAVLVPGPPGRLPPSAARTAQGGAEWVPFIQQPLEPALAVARKAGFSLAATAVRGGRNPQREPLPPRLLLLIGAEDVGLPAEVARHADLTVSIPGTGRVDSLNVAAATAVLLAELWRQHPRSPGSDHVDEHRR